MDRFLGKYNAEDRRSAAEFLSNWMPFLTAGLCETCSGTLSDRIRLLNSGESTSNSTLSNGNQNHLKRDHINCSTHPAASTEGSEDDNNSLETQTLGACKNVAYGLSGHAAAESPRSKISSSNSSSPKLNKTWADMTLEDELAEQEGNENGPENKIYERNNITGDDQSLNETKRIELSREEREYIRFRNVKRKRDFRDMERIKGSVVNILDGLELHTSVFSAAEQTRIVNYVEQLLEAGRQGKLKERTYSAPHKWMRGKGRITLQFGCCYNYATDRNGNPPGIMRAEIVDPLPDLFKVMIKRFVRWHVLPPDCVPDSCIVNIYEEGDCIPPHIDNHDFVRPFCTVSFLSECRILFGTNLRVVGPGEFAGSTSIPLPVGSVLVLNGNGADIAKHCVPAVPTRRISITFRKMDESKRPSGFVPEPDLQELQPLPGEVSQNNKEMDGTWKYNASRSRYPSRETARDRADRRRGDTTRYQHSQSSGQVRQGHDHRQRY